MPVVELRDPSSQHCGVWFSSSLSTRIPLHRHEGPELNLLMAGSVVYRLEHEVSELEARGGEVVVLPAGVAHELVHCSDDVALWVIELPGAGTPSWLDVPCVLGTDPGWRKATMSIARSLWLRPMAPKLEALQRELGSLLATFARSETAVDVVPAHPAVARAKRVCEQSVERELDVARLARESGLSASRLAHLFAEQVGITPLQYRNFARVQHFVRTYDGDERNLLRAALRAGFGSYSQFHRVFCQICGESPAAHFEWLSTCEQVDAGRTLGAVPAEPGSFSPVAVPPHSGQI